MGSEVVYCYQCQRRLTVADFQSGAALQVGSLTTCDACADALLDRLTPEQRRAVLRKREQAMEAADGTKRGATPPPKPPPPVHRAATHPPTAAYEGAARPRPRPPAVLVLAAAAVVVVALLLLVLFSGNRTAPPVPAPAPAAVRPPSPPHAAAGTEREPPAPQPATPPPEDLKRELEEVEKEVQAASQQQEYRKAQELLDRARARRTDAAWTAAVDARRKTLEESIRRYFDWVKAQALESRKSGSTFEVARWRDEVARWGLPPYIAELDKALTVAGEPLPLSETDGAALRQKLSALSLSVLPNANSRVMARLKDLGIQPSPLSWERVIDAAAFTPAACPVVIYACSESYRLTVKTTNDVPDALIRYVRAGGTLAVFSSGPWPFYCDESGMPNAHPMAPLLPLSGGWDGPPAGTTVSFFVTDPRALPHVPSPFRFPSDGDRRWRPIQPGQAKGGTRVTTLVELRDGTGRSLGAGAAWMHAGQGRVLYVWFRLLDLPEGSALFHDFWQAIAAK